MGKLANEGHSAKVLGALCAFRSMTKKRQLAGASWPVTTFVTLSSFMKCEALQISRRSKETKDAGYPFRANSSPNFPFSFATEQPQNGTARRENLERRTAIQAQRARSNPKLSHDWRPSSLKFLLSASSSWFSRSCRELKLGAVASIETRAFTAMKTHIATVRQSTGSETSSRNPPVARKAACSYWQYIRYCKS